MDQVFANSGWSLPMIGTPLHQPEEQLIFPTPVMQQQQTYGNSYSYYPPQATQQSLDYGGNYNPNSLTTDVIRKTTNYSIERLIAAETASNQLEDTDLSICKAETPTSSSSSEMVPATPHHSMIPMTPLNVDLPMTPANYADSHGIIPDLQNIVATANLNCKLDLKKIALHARNAEFNPKRFAAVIMRIRDPRTTALIFSSGKLVCTGAKSEEDSKLACRKFARIIQKLGFSAGFQEFKVQNMVGSCDIKFPIRLEGLVLAHGAFCSYEPELFPGLIYRMIRPKVVLLIFISGKIVLTGAKQRQDIYEAFNNIYPILKGFRK